MSFRQSLQVVVQYNDFECTLAMCVLNDVPQNGCDCHDDISRMEICLKTRHHVIFCYQHTAESAPACDEASKVAQTMVPELTVHAAENVVEMLKQTLVLQSTVYFLTQGS